MMVLNDKRYPIVGECIYCGSSDDLRDEHILAYALGGTSILPKSSCGSCAAITGSMEQSILRGQMWQVRLYRELQSRTKHKEAPVAYDLMVIKDGQERTLSVPIEDYPIRLYLPLFAPPGYLDPTGYESGIRHSGDFWIRFGPSDEEFLEKYGAESIKINNKINLVNFARMIAKIAYAWAAAEQQLQFIAGAPLVLPAILGERDDIGKWVGTITSPITKYEGLLHRVLIHQDEEKNVLFGEVHLFSDSETPTYGVILGRLRS